MNANPRLCFCKLNEGGVRQDGEGGLVKYTNDMSHRLIYLEVMLIWNNFLLGIKIRENLWQGSKVCKLGSILQSHSREYNAPVKQSIPFYLNHVSSQQDHCFGPVSNTYIFSTFEKVEELNGSATHGVTRLYLGLEPGSIFCFIDLSALAAQLEKERGCHLGSEPTNWIPLRWRWS